MIILIIFHSDVIRILLLQSCKESVKGRIFPAVLIGDRTCPEHLHDHWKVLFLLRRLISQIEYQCQQEHLRSGVPERITAGRTFRRGGLEKVRHQPLDIIVVPEVDKWIVAVALSHVDEIEHPDLISFCLQQVPGCPEVLSLRIQYHKRGVCLHQVRFAVEAGLPGTGASTHQYVEVSPVLPAVQPDPHVLCQDLVFRVRHSTILPVQLRGIAPYSRTHLFSSPVIPSGRNRDPDPYHIGT